MDNAPFGQLQDHASVVYDGRMWVIGGEQSTSGVWWSSNGTDWTQADDGGLFKAVYRVGLVSDGYKMLAVGGGGTTDVWRSTDGSNWQRTITAVFTNSHEHGVLAFNGRLWVFGRPGNLKLMAERRTIGDIWWTENGTTWTLAMEEAPYGPRYGGGFAVFKNKIWLVSGNGAVSDYGYLSDVWNSDNGTSWSRVTAAAPFKGRWGHGVLSHDGRLWVMGGGDVVNRPLGDVWWSDDGTSWTQATATAPVYGLGRNTISHGGQLWAFGLNPNNSDIMESWSSDDGASWTKEGSLNTRLANGHVGFGSCVSYGDRMYGVNNWGDVWASSDGRNWQVVNTTGPETWIAASVIYEDKVWLLAGNGSAVWRWDFRNAAQHWSLYDVQAFVPPNSHAASPETDATALGPGRGQRE